MNSKIKCSLLFIIKYFSNFECINDKKKKKNYKFALSHGLFFVLVCRRSPFCKKKIS